MNIPRFWASAEGEANTVAGRATLLKCFGWSDEGVAEARTRATEGLERLLARVREGASFPAKYAYADRPIREEILDEMQDADGQLQGLITRNAYGAAVLNTSGVMFVDIDDDKTVDALPQSLGNVVNRMFGRFFRRRPGGSETETPGQNMEANVPFVILAFARANPSWCLRCYRTCAGWRILVTHETFDPVSNHVRETLSALHSDKKYVELTRIQRCFRARLTPKPWRCDVPLPIRAFPREHAALQRTHAQWLEKYEKACVNFATCRYVTTLGSSDVCPAAETTTLWHDRITRAHEPLPLA